MTEHHIAHLCTQAGYSVTRVMPYGAFWRVYLHTGKGCTQATLDKRFGVDSGLMSYGFGWDAKGLSIVVGERESLNADTPSHLDYQETIDIAQQRKV